MRLGRAMGPQGLEFGNPLGFLSPSFNRLPDAWEIGDVVDFRVIVNHPPNGNNTANYEALVFPFQIGGSTGLLRALFVGAAVDSAIFYPVAFLGVWSTGDVLTVMGTNYLLKVLWEIIALPMTYRVVRALKRVEHEDHFDRDTDFTPFSLQAG